MTGEEFWRQEADLRKMRSHRFFGEYVSYFIILINKLIWS